MTSPADLGYRMPPEWAPQQCVWFSWPHNPDTWPVGGAAAAERALVPAIDALSASETVRLNVRDAGHESHVRRLLGRAADRDTVIFHHFATNDAWCRDHGAIFVTRSREQGDALLALDFEFNAWGGKYPPWDLDNAMPPKMATALSVPVYQAGMVLEGGSIDVNGEGALLTTEQCLLNPNRNPGMNRQQIETRLRECFGVSQIIWLGDGIVGDDTDGHIDDITRFVAADTVVTVIEPNPDDPNHRPLADNLDRLRAVRLADGRALRIVELPMPAPLEMDGERLPASYANFLIANRVVLVPVFGDPADASAVRILADCFPGRDIVPVDCRAILPGLGTLHCLSQQVPLPGSGAESS